MCAIAGYLDMLGLGVTRRGADGRVAFTADAGPALRNPDMNVHGGVLASLLAEALVRAATPEDAGPKPELVEMRVAYLRGTTADRLEVEAWVTRAGRRLAFVSARVREPGGREVAAAEGVAEPSAAEEGMG